MYSTCIEGKVHGTMASANRTRCGWKEPAPITMASGRRRRHCRSLSPAASVLLIGLVVWTVIGTTTAFVSPRSHAPSSLPLPLGSFTRISGKIPPTRTGSPTTVFVTLETPSTSPSDSDEMIDLKLHSSNNDTSIPADITSMEVTIESEHVKVVIPMEETDEQHMERVRMGDDVEELTHLLAHDQADLRPLISPSIPISYDENGMVQADASTPFAPTVMASEMIALSPNGAMAMANNEPDYPAFIEFLFKKDANGQTLASKVFNFVLLAASFGYVFTLVFNIDKGMTRGWSPVEISMRIPLDTWASYENSLSEKPVATKTIINIVIYLLGDWLSQTLFQKKNILDFDAARTLKNGFVGMCFGPAVHEYYEFSDWILPVDGVTMGITNRAFKILMDQTIYLSIKCSIYILAIGVLNGESLKSGSENVKNRIKPIMFTAWKFWPLVHCVTYGLIPARHRILWVNSVDLVWNAILASKARDDGDGDEDGETAGMEEEEGSIMEANGGGKLEANIDGDPGILQRIGIMPTYVDSPSSDDDRDDCNTINGKLTSGNEEKGDEEDSADENNILGAQWEDESSDSKE